MIQSILSSVTHLRSDVETFAATVSIAAADLQDPLGPGPRNDVIPTGDADSGRPVSQAMVNATVRSGFPKAELSG